MLYVMVIGVQFVHTIQYNLFKIFLSPSGPSLCRPFVLTIVAHTSQPVAQTSVAQVVCSPVVCRLVGLSPSSLSTLRNEDKFKS